MLLVTTSTANFYKNVYQKSIYPDHVKINVIARKNDISVPELNIWFWIKTNSKFSKWVYFDKFIKLQLHMPTTNFFDYYLFTDDDISFSAFPWISFNIHLHKEQPTIIGVPRESEWANNVVNLDDYLKNTKRDFFVHSNGDFWRQIHKRNNRWSYIYERNSQIDPSNLKFIEQGCTLFEFKFMIWFVDTIHPLILKMQTIHSDWVIDIMWCAASHEFSHKYCQMFGHPLWHYDKGTLTSFYNSKLQETVLFERNGNRLLKFAKKNSTFAKWIANASDDFTLFSKMNNFYPSSID